MFRDINMFKKNQIHSRSLNGTSFASFRGVICWDNDTNTI